MEHSITELMPELPSGPLDEYRQSASFSWKEMKVFFEGGEDLFTFKYQMFKILEKDPLFRRLPSSNPSIAEMRELAAKQVNALFKYDFLPEDVVIGNPSKIQKHSEVLAQFDVAMNARFGLSAQIFGNAVRALGTDQHLKFSEQARTGDIIGCFCLTELAHGSNTSKMNTTATYDRHTKEFVINTPRLEDMKCWVGNLGQSATHALVYAQLVTPDGVFHGLHGFVVPLRDTVTLVPYSGVLVGDMGPKIGFNSIENGFVVFDNVRIPRENLLNRTADVTHDGKYVTSTKSRGERQGITLGSLSSGRVGIVGFGAAALGMAITIALRYSACRRQFSLEEGGPEVPVIEYPLQRWRLFPYLASTFLIQHLTYSLFKNMVVFHTGILMGDKSEEQSQTGRELHAISCASKALSGFLMRDGLQECREACGGHGYLAASQLGRIRADFDPMLTYEGDNNVILIQTSNYLLSAWDEYQATGKVKSPLGTLNILLEDNNHIRISTANDWMKPSVVLKVFRWLTKFRLRRASERMAKLTDSGLSITMARAKLLPTQLRPLSINFAELLTLSRYYDEILCDPNTPSSLQPVLEKLFCMFGLWRLQNHSMLLLEGGFLNGTVSTTAIQEAQALLCDDLKPDAIALVDAIAPPDYVLASPLGMSDGQAYKHLIQAMLREPGVFERPSYWQIMVKSHKFESPAKL